jgi:hypothetical protein
LAAGVEGGNESKESNGSNESEGNNNWYGNRHSDRGSFGGMDLSVRRAGQPVRARAFGL